MNAGDLVAPSIRLVRPLGQGGMGRVWLAEHLTLKSEVVVKVMSDEISSDEASRARLPPRGHRCLGREEPARRADARPRPHRRRCAVHRDGAARRRGSLHRIARRRLEVHELAPILTQTCLGLLRAHQAGTIHRDIKPDNIFLCDVGGDEPFVKLLDFGIAKSAQNPALAGDTRTGALMGTPYYMSPEHFAGAKGVDHRSDLWSLGVVAFESLTGVRPFDAETFGGLAIAVHSTPIQPPSRVRPTCRRRSTRGWRAPAPGTPTIASRSARELADAFVVAAGGVPEMRLTPVPDAGPLRVTPLPEPTRPVPSTLMMTTGAAAVSSARVEDLQPAGVPRSSATPFVIAGVAVLALVAGALVIFLRPTAGSAPAPVVAASAPARSRRRLRRRRGVLHARRARRRGRAPAPRVHAGSPSRDPRVPVPRDAADARCRPPGGERPVQARLRQARRRPLRLHVF